MFELLLKNKNLTIVALIVGGFYVYNKMLETERLKLEIELLKQQLEGGGSISGHPASLPDYMTRINNGMMVI